MGVEREREEGRREREERGLGGEEGRGKGEREKRVNNLTTASMGVPCTQIAGIQFVDRKNGRATLFLLYNKMTLHVWK